MKEIPTPEEPTVLFQDKKESVTDYQRITNLIQEASEVSKQLEVGQEEATVIVHPEYPNLPVVFQWMTDIHYGNVGTNYQDLNYHLEIAEFTPNFYIIFGGDIVENFSASKHPVAILGDAIPPQIQAQAMMERIKELDRKSKVLALGYGNHESFMDMAGYDFYQTFMADVSAPIFNANGLLNLVVGRENYRIGIFHKFWGQSKINLSNRGKRAMEYGGYPDCDIVLIGDDHQASAELFSKGNQRKLVIDGGTYKQDATGKKWGLGPAGKPGYTVFLWPNEHRFEMVSDPKVAKDMMEGMVYLNSATE